MSTEGKVTTDNVVVAKVNAMKTVNGKNAYEMAVLHGYTGTFEDWIASITSGRLTDGHREAIADLVVEKLQIDFWLFDIVISIVVVMIIDFFGSLLHNQKLMA